MRAPDDMRYNPKARYQDVILTRQAGHFTLLLPSDEDSSFKKKPIDMMLREAEIYQIQVYDIPAGQLKRFCVSDVLTELRQPPRKVMQSPTVKVSVVVPETQFGGNDVCTDNRVDMPQPSVTTLVAVGTGANKGVSSSSCVGSFSASCNVQ